MISNSSFLARSNERIPEDHECSARLYHYYDGGQQPACCGRYLEQQEIARLRYWWILCLYLSRWKKVSNTTENRNSLKSNGNFLCHVTKKRTAVKMM